MDHGKDSGRTIISLPQKRYYRQRAHSNPIADHCIDYPVKPSEMNWKKLYPEFYNDNSQEHHEVKFADIGCGYGGLLVTLSPMFPKSLILGLEIRVKVSDYVVNRILALRSQFPGQYQNIACIRSNAMKYLPNYFSKGQHRWRIISTALLAEYAYVLAEGGLVYTITDVFDLHEWMVQHFDSHPLFERVTDEELSKDPVVDTLYQSTEEGKKVTRNNGSKYLAVYKRIKDPYVRDES
ncbi:UNVERIFIED_CONTAM: hypothetical protein PYX00_005428 [Menopon gallinae]|uniref:tRNA (guanine-N(7)-)-methyltransferase n=1 Tax=Menopon gallinae TaxID=328185 RepID=A0AAW2HSB6_9NEOP